MPDNYSGNTGTGNWGQDARSQPPGEYMSYDQWRKSNGNDGKTSWEQQQAINQQYNTWREGAENANRQTGTNGPGSTMSWNDQQTFNQWRLNAENANRQVGGPANTPTWNSNTNTTNPKPATGGTSYENIAADMANEVPYDINGTSQSYIRNLLSQYQQDTGDALGYMKKAGEVGVAGYSGLNDFYSQAAAQNNAMALNQGRQMENTYGSAYKTATGAAGQALGYGMQAGQGQLADTNKMMGYYQSLAAKNQLPGQSLIEQNLGQNTAEAMSRMKEMGGSSMALLGASGNMYNQQQAGLRDIGIQASQYQAGNQQAQAQAAQQAIGLRAGAYGQMAGAQNLYGQNMQNAASQYGGAQERYMANQQNAYGQGVGWQAAGKLGLTQAQEAQQGNLSNFYGNQATQTSGLFMDLDRQRREALQQQADLTRRALLDQSTAEGAGYNAASDAEYQNWQQNQYNQWANQFQYWNQYGTQNTQPGVSNATSNAIGLWGQQSQNQYNQAQLDLARTNMWVQAGTDVVDSISKIDYNKGE
jgi:hypothetical protein